MEIPISAENLAKRWGLKPIDLFFIMWSHDLNVLTQNGNFIDVKEVLECIPQEERDKRLGIEAWSFSLNEVEILEKASLGKLLSIDHEVIRGQDLIDKWDMDDFAIHAIASQKGWEFVDPFGQPISDQFFLGMCSHGNFSISEAWFKTSDVEKVEKELQIKPKPFTGKKERKLRPEQKHRENCRVIAEQLWKKDPKITIADMAVSEEIYNACDEIMYTEKTIRKWIKELCPDRSPGRRPKKKGS
jgi:hypothetical protein